MKPSRSQFYFLGGILVWVVMLQSIMLWYLSATTDFICNERGAWPFSGLPLFGSATLTIFFTLLVGIWAWKDQEQEILSTPASFLKLVTWVLIVATGISHALERVVSQCIVDYWILSVFTQSLYFNLGDLSLTLGTLFFIGYWFWRKSRG